MCGRAVRTSLLSVIPIKANRATMAGMLCIRGCFDTPCIVNGVKSVKPVNKVNGVKPAILRFY